MGDKEKLVKPKSQGFGPGLLSLHLVSFTLMYLIGKNMLQLDNVEQELSFYWLYHSHPANQLVSPYVDALL